MVQENIEHAVIAKTQTAVDLWFDQKYEKALDELDIVFRLNPNYVRAHNVKALALAGLGKYEESFEAAHKSIEIDPNNGISYSIFGICYSKSGNNDEAIEMYLLGIQYAPDNFITHYNYACFLVETGELEKCADILETAYELSPTIVEGLIERDPDIQPLKKTGWFNSYLANLTKS